MKIGTFKHYGINFYGEIRKNGQLQQLKIW